MVNVEADADFFADGVVVVRRNQRQDFGTACQAQRVKELGAAESAMKDRGLQRAVIVVDDVVRSQ